MTAADTLTAAAERLRTLQPDAICLALADWLEHEARQERYYLAEFGYRMASAPAMAVARAVLGVPR